MVGVSAVLSRIPMIKFRKGGLGRLGGPSAAAPAAAAKSAGAAPQPQQAQAAAAMSTVSIPDVDLPARYRRQPFTEEEIDTINGGGEEELKDMSKPQKPKHVAVIRVPKGLLSSPGKKKHLVSVFVERQ